MTKDQVKTLKAYPAVIDVEDEGMDEGRFFVHLREGWSWTFDPHQETRTKSFGSYREAITGLKKNVKPV